MSKFVKSQGKVVLKKDCLGSAIRDILKCKCKGIKYIWFARDILGLAFYPKLKDKEEYEPREAFLFKCVKKQLTLLTEHSLSAGLSQEELVRKIDTTKGGIDLWLY